MSKEKKAMEVIRLLNDRFNNIDADIEHGSVSSVIVGTINDTEFKIALNDDATTNITSVDSELSEELIELMNEYCGQKATLKSTIEIDGIVTFSGAWNDAYNPEFTLRILKSSLVAGGVITHSEVRLLSASLYDEKTDSYTNAPKDDLDLNDATFGDLLGSVLSDLMRKGNDEDDMEDDDEHAVSWNEDMDENPFAKLLSDLSNSFGMSDSDDDDYEELDDDDMKETNPLAFLEKILGFDSEKGLPDDRSLVRGIYPGELKGVEDEVASLDELRTYQLIRHAISEEEYNTRFPFADKNSPKELKELSYAKDFAIYQSRRFGTNIPDAEEGKPLQLTEEFNEFMDYYDKFFEKFDKHQRDEYTLRCQLGLDTSMYEPEHLWSEQHKLYRKL